MEELDDGTEVKELSTFQKKKLSHFFRIFYDTNHDGIINQSDFNSIIDEVRRSRQWQDTDPRMMRISEASKKLFRRMSQTDEDNTQVTVEEWLDFWDKFCKEAQLARGGWPVMGLWQQEYAKVMFEFMDTAGDCVIDQDEYVSVVTNYGKTTTEDAKECFERLTTEFDSKGDWKEYDLDLRRYMKMYLKFLTSNDPSEPANFLWGKLPDE